MIKIFTVYDPKEFKHSKGKYTDEHIYRLEDMLNEQVIQPYNFSVIMSDWPGWWGKIELFQFDQVFYLDLSVAIIQPIDHIIDATGDFMACRDFVFPELMNSKVMSWKGDYSYVFDKFAADPERFMAQYQGGSEWWGDQSFINHTIKEKRYFQDLFPNEIVSYKLGEITKETRIIGFHGKPKPEETEYWKV